MLEAQIYIKNIEKQIKSEGGVSSLNWGGLYPPLGGCTNITLGGGCGQYCSEKAVVEVGQSPEAPIALNRV